MVVRVAFDSLRCDLLRLQEDLLVLHSEVSDVNHNAAALTKGLPLLLVLWEFFRLLGMSINANQSLTCLGGKNVLSISPIVS